MSQWYKNILPDEKTVKGLYVRNYEGHRVTIDRFEDINSPMLLQCKGRYDKGWPMQGPEAAALRNRLGLLPPIPTGGGMDFMDVLCGPVPENPRLQETRSRGGLIKNKYAHHAPHQPSFSG